MSQENEISNANELMSVGQSFDSKQYARDILAATKNGEVNPLKAYTVVKRMENIAKTVLEDKEFKKLGLDEVEKHLSGNQKTIELYSAKISKAVTYTYFEFQDCGHPVWDELDKIEKIVKEAKKLIEEELKLLIPKETSQIGLGITNDTKQIVVEKVPMLQWLDNEDQVTVQAPKKIQQIGIKFLKV